MFFYSEPDIVTQDPYFYNTSLLLNMDSNFSDSSVYQNSATTGGGVSISTVDFKYGDGSGYFNGNGDAISIVSSDSLDLSGQDWTIETWIRPNGDYSNWRMILAKRNSSGDYNYQLYLDRYTGELRFYPGGAPSDVVTGVTPQANVWSHVAVARSNGTVTVYLNGNSVGSMVSDTDFNSAPLGIGCVANGVSGFGGHGFFGHIDDVRITKGVARYTTNFTPPTEPHLTTGPSEIVSTGLQLHLDAGDTASYPGTGTAWYDLSGNGNNSSLINGTGYSSDDGGTIIFDGIDDYIVTPIATTYQSFTISTWFFTGNQTRSRPTLISKSSFYATTSSDWPLSIYIDGNSVVGRITNGTSFSVSEPSNGAHVTSPQFQSDTWLNVVVSYDGQTFKMYSDGVLVDSTAVSISLPNNTSRAYTIGRTAFEHDGGTNTSQYKGKMSQVLIYNSALVEAQILQNFHATKDRFGL